MHYVPQPMALRSHHAARMCHPCKHRKLLILRGKLVKETQQFRFASVAIMLRARDAYFTCELLRIDQWQISRHVQVGAARDAVAELQFEIGERFYHGRIGGASDIPIKNIFDLLRSKRAAGICCIKVHLLAAPLYFGGVITGIRKCVKNETLHTLRGPCRESARAYGPGGLSEQQNGFAACLLFDEG